ncbi:MAG: glycoside hydrolase family 31 protein [Bacillota bacterium]|nr:glycoside hydrolase family 31 protein [Bacillota bacterium]
MVRQKVWVAGIAAAVALAGAITVYSTGILSDTKVNGNLLTISQGKDKITVKLCKDDLVKVDFLPEGKATAHTEVIADNKWDGANEGNNVKAQIDTKSNPMTIKTDKMIVKIDKKTKRISIYDSKGNMLIKEQDVNDIYNKGVKFDHNSGDKFYGISGYTNTEESTAGMLKTGNVDVTAGAQGHPGGPFVWSTKGYGVLVDSNGGDFSIKDTSLTFDDCSKKDIEYYVAVGKPTDIIEATADVTGKSPMFPKWATGFTNSEWGIDEKELTNIVDTYRSKNIPIDNYTLDFDWKAWGQDNNGEFRWNDTKFPDGSSGKLKEIMDSKGIKLTGIMKPRIHVDTVEGKYAEQNKLWHPNSVVGTDYFSGKQVRDLNFADSNLRKWFFNNAKGAMDTGIAGWWNDEADEVNDNFQFMNMQKAMYEGQRAANDTRVWSINRDFYLGSQRYAYGMWSGDIPTGFYSMEAQRERMLSAINLAEPKWGMDTGGFNGNPNPENYARWIEFSAFTPIFRVHGNLDDQRQPWVFGDTAEAAAKKAIQLRYKLIPYIYAYDRKAYETGVGLVKPLVFDYSEDKNVENDVDAWMFGDYMLVSPVVQEGQTSKKIYLPKGTWIDYFTGKTYEGGSTIDYTVNANTYDDIPLFVKKGAIIPNQDSQNYVGEKPVTNVYVDIFPDKEKTSFNYYDDDGKTYQYEKGVYFKQNIDAQDKGNGQVNINLSAKTGSYTPETKYFILKVHGKASDSVNLGSSSVKAYGSLDDLMNAEGEGTAKGQDVYGEVTYVKVKLGDSKSINVK